MADNGDGKSGGGGPWGWRAVPERSGVHDKEYWTKDRALGDTTGGCVPGRQLNSTQSNSNQQCDKRPETSRYQKSKANVNFTARLQHIYGRTVVLLYKPTYDEKQKADY